MIDKDKQYTTRDGREVRIYATDSGGIFPVHGAFHSPCGKWVSCGWRDEGVYYVTRTSNLDLIEVKPRIRRTLWLLVYDTYCMHSKEKPPVICDDCKACVKVEIDCEEGEGLCDH